MDSTSRQNKNSLPYQLRTFKYAFNGLIQFFRTESKARIHFILALIAIAAGVLLKIEITGWIGVSIAIGIVFVSELINTVIEQLVDHISPERSEMAKTVKDLSAAIVLFASIMALAIGLLVFLPKIILIICRI
jgi:undecaprenol kinase